MGALKKLFMDEIELNPISDDLLHSSDMLGMQNYLRLSNEVKRRKAIEQLGSKWVLHPSHSPSKEVRT